MDPSHSGGPDGNHQEYIRVQGTPIRFIQKGGGVPLLLLPSSGGQGKEFSEIIPALSKSFRVITFDYPGFGGSGENPTIKGLKDLTHFSKKFLNGLQIGRPHILGFSMGGWVALHYALSFPENILKLILLASTGKPFSTLNIPNPTRLSFNELLENFFFDSAAKEKMEKRKLTRTEKKEIFRSNQTFNRLIRLKSGQPDLTPSLIHLKCPTLILGGEYDKIISRDNLKSLHRQVPYSTLKWVKGAGHALIYEKPQEVSSMILNFLKEQ